MVRYGTVSFFCLPAEHSPLITLAQFLFNDLIPPPSCLPSSPPVDRDTDAEETEALLSSPDETTTLPEDPGFDVIPQGRHVQAKPTHVGN